MVLIHKLQYSPKVTSTNPRLWQPLLTVLQKAQRKSYLLMTVILLLASQQATSQQDTTSTGSQAQTDTLSKFDRINKKIEGFFKVFPVPIISYSSDAGNTFGLAKFNAFQLPMSDSISRPSKISGVATFSTKGRINVSLSNDLIFKQNKYIILSYFNYKRLPEYLLGIGNDVSIDNLESVTSKRVKFYSNPMMRIGNNDKLYIGASIDLDDYFEVAPDSNSFIIKDRVTGREGGLNFGLGASLAFDNRDNRYNPHSGSFAICNLSFYEHFWGSKYQFTKFELDLRKYFNPWYKHVIALQATTTGIAGDPPFYSLAMLGGENKMRGYYQGALRDKVLVDAQVEYRMPVWNIFGIVGWVGTGEVADKYRQLSLDGLWLSYGAGLRVRVDSDNNINMRLDFGFGPHGINGVYINFAEAF